MPVNTSREGEVAVLRLELPRSNAINLAFVQAVNHSLDEVERSQARALVLTGQPRAFCVGLDLIEAYDYDRPGMNRFVDGFDDLFLRLYAFPLPVVGAINGHAIAGGCVLAMAADHRLMVPDSATIGLNEVLLGIPFPGAAFEISRSALLPATWPEWLMEGQRWSPQRACAAGAVHRLVAEQDIVAEAVAKARALCAAPAGALREIKRGLKAPVLARIAEIRAESRARFVEHWFSPAGRSGIGAVREKLLRKKAPPP